MIAINDIQSNAVVCVEYFNASEQTAVEHNVINVSRTVDWRLYIILVSVPFDRTQSLMFMCYDEICLVCLDSFRSLQNVYSRDSRERVVLFVFLIVISLCFRRRCQLPSSLSTDTFGSREHSVTWGE